VAAKTYLVPPLSFLLDFPPPHSSRVSFIMTFFLIVICRVEFFCTSMRAPCAGSSRDSLPHLSSFPLSLLSLSSSSRPSILSPSYRLFPLLLRPSTAFTSFRTLSFFPLLSRLLPLSVPISDLSPPSPFHFLCSPSSPFPSLFCLIFRGFTQPFLYFNFSASFKEIRSVFPLSNSSSLLFPLRFFLFFLTFALPECLFCWRFEVREEALVALPILVSLFRRTLA